VLETHPLVEGVDLLCERYSGVADCSGMFQELYELIRTNWMRYREPDRWPTSDKNWVLRVAPTYTADPNHRIEKQLQKQIAICLENDDWGNDICTASGLINRNGRHMNIDLAHRTAEGFELVELKVNANTPFEAAVQILRYGAIYMLYRIEPELSRRFKSNAMLRARRITLEVLAPRRYYPDQQDDLRLLEAQLHREVEMFGNQKVSGLAVAFRFMAFPPEFNYRPGMECSLLRDAIRRRASPFAAD